MEEARVKIEEGMEDLDAIKNNQRIPELFSEEVTIKEEIDIKNEQLIPELPVKEVTIKKELAEEQCQSSSEGLSKKKNVNFVEFQNLSTTEFVSFLEEIPSDVDSVVSDEDTGISEDEEEPENVEIVILEDTDVLEAEDVQWRQSLDGAWSDEDDGRLLVMQDKLHSEKFDWNNDNSWKEANKFEEPSGSNIDNLVELPVEVFLQLFTEELFDLVAFQTNLYATQKNHSNANFIPTTSQEMKAFFAINLLMGIKKMSSYKDYWSSYEELRDGYISPVMSRNRFQWLLSHLHFNDNNLQPNKGHKNFDKLYKIRPILRVLEKTFRDCYLPKENQAINEFMVKFKDTSTLRHLPQKPIKRGYKVWIRSDESGYICEFQIYTGKISGLTEKSLGNQVVKNLTKNLVGKYHKLYFDDFFNSAKLQRELLQNGIYSCGTIRRDTKNLPKLQGVKKRGEYNWKMTSDGLVTVEWMDKKPVLFISNFHNPEKKTKVKRKKKDGELEDIPCPTLICDYNGYMGLVDKGDMLKKLYQIDRKSKKWYYRLVWYFVDLCVVNAFIIFKERSQGKTMSLKMFRLAIVSGLIGAGYDKGEKRKRGNTEGVHPYKRYVPVEKRYDKVAHLPVRGTSLRCAFCSTRAEPHRSRWKCSTCEVGLCLNDKKNCFYMFHTK